MIQNNWFLLKYILTCDLFLWCKAEFSASLLQSSVSHDIILIILIYIFTHVLFITYVLPNLVQTVIISEYFVKCFFFMECILNITIF